MARLPYQQLIEIKQWADRGLCDAVEHQLDRLSEQEVDIIRLVFDHIHTVDRIFQHHLSGRPHSCRAARSEVLPTLDALKAGIAEADDWYVSYVKALAPEGFDEPVDFVFTSGKPARMRRGEILLHVSLHGTYHRGNAGAVLQLKGLPASRDAITDYLEDMGVPHADRGAMGACASPSVQ